MDNTGEDKLIHEDEHKTIETTKNNRKIVLSFLPDDSETNTTDDEDSKLSIKQGYSKEAAFSSVGQSLKINTTIKRKKSRLRTLGSLRDDMNRSAQSLPDLTKSHSRPDLLASESEMALSISRYSTDAGTKRISSQNMSSKSKLYQELLKILRVNYSKKKQNSSCHFKIYL